MRRRLLWSMVAVAFAATLVFGIPLYWTLDRLAHNAVRSRVQATTTTVSLVVQRGLAEGAVPDAEDLDNYISATQHLEVTYPNGDRVEVGDRIDGDEDLVRSSATTRDGAIVEVAETRDSLNGSLVRSIGIVVTLGATGMVAASLFALFQARRLARPLEELSGYAGRLGTGDFVQDLPRSGVQEIDAVAEGLESASDRIERLLDAERSFATNASHQLRSALTGLTLTLDEIHSESDEEGRPLVEDAIERAGHLLETVEDLLRLSRTGQLAEKRTFDLTRLVLDHCADRERVARARSRSLQVFGHQQVFAAAAAGAVGQAIDILLANAIDHGRGRISVGVTTTDGYGRITVQDEGMVGADASDTLFGGRRRGTRGIGLPLARDLIEAEGGVLVLQERSPTTFAIMVPLAGGPSS